MKLLIKTLSDYGIEYSNELGQQHRLDGPAFEFGEYKAWWVNGKRHRLDGPAVDYGNNAAFEYWIDGILQV